MAEPNWREPPEESIGTQVEKVLDLRPRDLVVRFVFGAVTSAVAGSLSILFSPIVGGVFLAFPAILAASLTLIAEEEDRREAREDARGAAVGAVALAAFAGVGALLFTEVAWPLALAAACGAWIVGALGLYLALWFRPGATSS
jgi:uncharacterized membrane protein (GlpM family)